MTISWEGMDGAQKEMQLSLAQIISLFAKFVVVNLDKIREERIRERYIN